MTDIEKTQKKIERLENAIEKSHEAIEKRLSIIDKKKNAIENAKPNLDKKFMKMEFLTDYVDGHWIEKKASELPKETQEELYVKVLADTIHDLQYCIEESEAKLKKLTKKLESQEAELKQVKEKNADLDKIFSMVSEELHNYVERIVRSQYRTIEMDEDLKETAIQLDTDIICESMSLRAYSIVGDIKSWKIIGLSDSRASFEVLAFGSDEKEYYAHLNNIVIFPYERYQYDKWVLVRAHYRNTTTRCNK